MSNFILVGGLPGSGKSQVSQIIADKISAAFLDKDTISSPFTGAMLEDPRSRDSQDYFSRVRPLEYKSLINTAEENLALGNSVVASAPFLMEMTNASWIARLKVKAEGLGAALSLVWVAASEQDMRRNIIRRNKARDQWKITHWPEYISSVDLSVRPAEDYFLVENSGSFNNLYKRTDEILISLVKEKADSA